MKARLGKFGIVFLALALVLSVSGAAFAMWSDTLTISGDVFTGEVSVSIDSQYDNDVNLNDPCEPGYWDVSTEPVWVGSRYIKNVAQTTSTYDLENGEWGKIIVTNGYPCYWGSVIWDVHNDGTIPVRLYSVTLTELSFGGSPMWTGSVPLTIGTRYYVDVDKPAVDETLDEGDDFSLILSCEACCQIDPEASGDVGYIDATVHVEQDAQQKSQYDFTVEFVFAQWNEGLACPPAG